ncbi:MAG TPA: pitrilysin family protein [Candidatus Bathyarchaeia archaeon]|nr:pitrilysin family protein [Candidatus Bathyarchaeia archaeon]
MRHLLRALGLLALALALPASAGPLAHREVLPNGSVLLVAERAAIPIVVVRLSVRAGSVYDPADAGGLANLTADLLTRGTARRTGPELDRAIEFVGGGLEGEAGRDSGSLSLSVLKKDLGLGLDLLAEALLTPTFPEDELARRRVDIAAAIDRSEQDPGSVAARVMAELLYPGHPYSRPVTGTVASVKGLTREQVIRFHRDHYRPDTAVIAVVGDVTADEIRRELWARLGSWSTPGTPLPVIPPTPALPPVEARVIHRDLTQATIYLARPGIKPDHPDYFPLVVANYVLGGGSASRLYTKVREERGLAYSVWSALGPGRYGASYMVGLQTRIDAADEAVRLTRAEMDRMGQETVPARELDLAKSYLIGSYPLRTDTSGKMAGFLVLVEEGQLGLDWPDRFKAGIARVSAADVRRVAGIYMNPATFSSVMVGK